MTVFILALQSYIDRVHMKSQVDKLRILTMRQMMLVLGNSLIWLTSISIVYQHIRNQDIHWTASNWFGKYLCTFNMFWLIVCTCGFEFYNTWTLSAANNPHEFAYWNRWPGSLNWFYCWWYRNCWKAWHFYFRPQTRWPIHWLKLSHEKCYMQSILSWWHYYWFARHLCAYVCTM